MWSVTTSHRRQQTWSPADCQSHIIPLVRAGRQQFELTQFCQISAAHDITTCSAGDAVASILHTGYAQLSACSEFNQCWFSVVPTCSRGRIPGGSRQHWPWPGECARICLASISVTYECLLFSVSVMVSGSNVRPEIGTRHWACIHRTVQKRVGGQIWATRKGKQTSRQWPYSVLAQNRICGAKK